METQNLVHENEIDLRQLFLPIFNKWYVFLIVFIVGGISGFAINPQYTASSTIYIKDLSFVGSIYNDSNLNQVAQTLDIPKEDLLTPKITKFDNTANLYTITIKAPDATSAILQANTLADVITQSINKTIITQAENTITKAKSNVNKANNDLVEYLDKQSLNQLTWLDLLNISGVDSNTYHIFTSSQDMVNTFITDISLEQRIQISDLVRTKVYAENVYQDEMTKNTEKIFDLQQGDFSIVSKANIETVEKTHLESRIKDSVLGATGGLLACYLIVIFIIWWKNPEVIANSQ